MATITINHEISDLELWSSIWGSGFETDPVARNYLMSYEFISGTWENLGVVEIKYVDEHDPSEGEDESKWLTKWLTIEDLTNALQLAMSEGYRHVPCGGAIDTDTDRWDACVADIIIQLALYGKEVWA